MFCLNVFLDCFLMVCGVFCVFLRLSLLGLLLCGFVQCVVSDGILLCC